MKAEKEYKKAIKVECARHGVSCHFDHSKKHGVAVLHHQDQKRKFFFPASPSDTSRGIKNAIADIRRIIRQLKGQDS